MPNAYAFDAQGAKEIAETVRAARSEPTDLRGRHDPHQSKPPETCIGKITAYNSMEQNYSWSEVFMDTGDWSVLSDGRTGTATDNFALPIDATKTYSVDDIVPLRRSTRKQTGGTFEQVWQIIDVAAGGTDVLYGKATADWASGNTATLDPCDENGTDNGEANVLGYIFMPTGASAACPQIFSGDILAYVEIDATASPKLVLILGVNPLPGPPTTDGFVLTRDSGTVVWGPVIAM